jgi:predicted TIM-barrel fold metal-dependent hydrolase
MVSVLAIPESIEHLSGRIIDVDSHESMPIQVWEDAFGEIAAPLVEAFERRLPPDPNNGNNLNVPDFPGDVSDVRVDTIWKLKGALAPSSSDLSRRDAVLDIMGVERQMIFPGSLGLWGVMIRTGSGAAKLLGLDEDFDTLTYSDQMLEAYNGWIARQIQDASISKRCLPVAVLYGRDPDDVLANVRGLQAQGIRVLCAIGTEMIGGLTPAHEDLDPVWKFCASHDLTVTVHIGDQASFLRYTSWNQAPIFEGYRQGNEFDLDPWSCTSVHLGAQNFVATMVSGGVFERHPRLRCGVMEFGAYWIGPLCRLMDMWWEEGGIGGGITHPHWPHLSEPPSFYVKRNVRVSAFQFERVDEYIETYGLEDVLCYSSDYPHLEGGKDPMVRFSQRLARLGPEVTEKFFVTNGEWVVPG